MAEQSLQNNFFDTEYLREDLKGRSVRGGMTTMSAQVIKFVLSTAGIVVLARLLTPNDYGLIGMVTVVVNFAAMFKDAGLSMATVQKDKITHDQISTLFWINILISAFLGICILAASPLVARFYGRQELTAVTAALSVSFVISGLMIQHQALMRRHMQFGKLAIIQIASQVITLGVTIVLALLGWRYWALVGGSIAAALAGVLLTFFFCPWIPGGMKKGTGVRDMLKFGGHLTGFNFINYFARNADNMLIGKFIGANALGLYTKAYSLFMLPISQIRGPLNQVALPVLSSLRNQPDRYVKYYQRLLDIMASLTIPLTLYSVIEAKFLISLLLGAQWLGAVSVFRILAIAGLIQALATTWGVVVISCGFTQRYLVWGLINAIVCVVSFVLGLPFGIEGVAAFYTVANYIMLFPTLWACFSGTPVTIALFLKSLLGPLFASTLAAGIVVLVKHLLASNTVVVHSFYIAIFGVVYVGLSWSRPSVRETSRMILEGLPLSSGLGLGAREIPNE